MSFEVHFFCDCYKHLVNESVLCWNRKADRSRVWNSPTTQRQKYYIFEYKAIHIFSFIGWVRANAGQWVKIVYITHVHANVFDQSKSEVVCPNGLWTWVEQAEYASLNLRFIGLYTVNDLTSNNSTVVLYVESFVHVNWEVVGNKDRVASSSLTDLNVRLIKENSCRLYFPLFSILRTENDCVKDTLVSHDLKIVEKLHIWHWWKRLYILTRFSAPQNFNTVT